MQEYAYTSTIPNVSAKHATYPMKDTLHSLFKGLMPSVPNKHKLTSARRIKVVLTTDTGPNQLELGDLANAADIGNLISQWCNDNDPNYGIVTFYEEVYTGSQIISSTYLWSFSVCRSQNDGGYTEVYW